MALEFQTNPNDDLFIRLQLSINDTGLYPRTIIYAIDAPTVVVDTVDLTELSNGLYGKKWTNNGERKKYFTQTIVYTDSGHTTVHPIIRPDSDSINVGFNTTGGIISMGGRGGARSVKVERLTEEEIKRIAQELFTLVKPELDKKSEFNPKTDIVKTDLVIPPQKEVIIPPMKPIVIPPIPSIQEIGKTIKDIITENIQIEKAIDYLPSFEKLNQTIENNKLEIPAIPEPKDYSVELLSLNSKLKELTKGSQEDGLINQILRLINLNGDSLEVYMLFRVLGAKEKKLIFNFLAKNNPVLLKELGQIAEAEKIISELKSAPDKNWKFNEMISRGRIKSNLIPIINKVANVF